MTFPVFDTLWGLDGKPGRSEAAELGLRRTLHLTGGALFGNRPRDTVHSDLIRQEAARAAGAGKMMCLDIEHWSLKGETFETSRRRLIDVADIVRDEVPNLVFGFYRLMPNREWFAVVKRSPDGLDRWRENNRKLRRGRSSDGRWTARGLSDAVHVVFPSLYAFYPNQHERWLLYARENLREARKYQKPVYPFLHPYYVDDKSRGVAIPTDEWRDQLDLGKTHADGVVLWHGTRKTSSRRDIHELPWWPATKQWLVENMNG